VINHIIYKPQLNKIHEIDFKLYVCKKCSWHLAVEERYRNTRPHHAIEKSKMNLHHCITVVSSHSQLPTNLNELELKSKPINNEFSTETLKIGIVEHFV